MEFAILIGIFVIAAILFWTLWRAARPSAPPVPPAPPPDGGAPAHAPWCFVGADLTGRWCIKTPEAGLCPADRTFHSRAECEMKTASASPLGITQDHNTTMIPIAGLAIA